MLNFRVQKPIVEVPKEKLFRTESVGNEMLRNLAEKLEHQIFSYMLAKRICVVYTYTETEKKDSTVTSLIKISGTRIEGKECTERNFENLVKMSDEDFEKLTKPYYSKNFDIVCTWRDIMRKELGVS